MATWTFDPAHTSVSFSARHMMVTTVRGSFGTPTGKLVFDPEHPENSFVEAVIDTTTVSTGVADRDNHLRSADFLDVANFPTMAFKSTKVEVTSDDEARVTGDLTIRGVTHPVTLTVEYLGALNSPFGDKRAGFAATAKINREDWGLTWNVAVEAGGVLVSKDIKISIDVEAVLQTETDTAAAASV